MQPSKPNERDTVRIDLTDEQKAQVKRATGRDGDAIELTVRELEERIAPTMGWIGNHNETLLAER